jgi:hypothetical protein
MGSIIGARTRIPPMAQPAHRLDDEDIPLDPTAIERAYRRERARRRARARHEQETSLARVRFWTVMVVLLAGAIVLLVLVWHEVEQLFGL